jgi:hypothetical protein
VALIALLVTVWLALAARAGSITGAVDRADAVAAVQAINRETRKVFPGRCDAATGRFAVDSLPLGAEYDLAIDYAGARLEGVNLAVPPAEEAEDRQPMTEDDRKVVTAKVCGMNTFEDVVEILAMTGTVRQAAILLNKQRTKPFYGSKPGEMIWRAEIWHFEKPEETWAKRQDEQFVLLYRERLPRAEYARKTVTFDPALGGFRPTAGTPVVGVGTVRLPAAEVGVRMR